MKHHICIHDDYLTCDNDVIPFGRFAIEKDLTRAINEILDIIVPKIGEGEIILCGDGDAKRMLGRKLEDRLKRTVAYE